MFRYLQTIGQYLTDLQTKLTRQQLMFKACYTKKVLKWRQFVKVKERIDMNVD